MIPLGLYGAARPVPPTIVQVKTALDSTLTLDAAPTPGNLLVLGMSNGVTTPASWTYSHDVSLDVDFDRSGWDAALASGTVQAGDSATVTVTGMHASYAPRLTVWECSGVTGMVGVDSTGDGAYATSLTLGVTSGALVFAAGVFSGGISGPAATGMALDLSESRGVSFSALNPAQPFTTTITWTNGRNAAAVLGGYA